MLVQDGCCEVCWIICAILCLATIFCTLLELCHAFCKGTDNRFREPSFLNLTRNHNLQPLKGGLKVSKNLGAIIFVTYYSLGKWLLV